MPHIIVKLWPGKTSEEKSKLAEQFRASMNKIMGIPESVITMVFDEVQPGDWNEKVKKPLIEGDKTGEIYFPDGYK